MSVDENLITAFEKAVESELKELAAIAADMGALAIKDKEKHPDIDPWELPAGEMQHCINGALQNIVYASLGEFEIVSRGLENYVDRIAALEDQLTLERRPSKIIRSIKARLDQSIGRNL